MAGVDNKATVYLEVYGPSKGNEVIFREWLEVDTDLNLKQAYDLLEKKFVGHAIGYFLFKMKDADVLTKAVIAATVKTNAE